MSLKTGFPCSVIKFAIPSTATNNAFTNGGLQIGSLKAGRYLCVLSYAISPLVGGQTITAVNASVTAVAVAGAGTAIGLLQQNTQPGTAAGATASKISLSSVITLSADAPIFISIVATTSGGGNYQTVINTLDSLSNTISFIQLQ